MLVKQKEEQNKVMLMMQAGNKIDVPQLLPFRQEENAQLGYFETLNYFVMWIGSDAESDLKSDPNWVNAVKEAKERF